MFFREKIQVTENLENILTKIVNFIMLHEIYLNTTRAVAVVQLTARLFPKPENPVRIQSSETFIDFNC